MLAIVDYGVGNLFSLRSSLKYIGIDSTVTSDAEELRRADRIILPGVGAFGDAMQKLRDTGLDKVLIEQAENGKPLMGICLGMQMLFDSSCEYGNHKGLGLIDGDIISMKDTLDDSLMIPHIGWNALKVKKETPLLKYVNNGDHVYFVHSFYLPGENENAVAVTDYGKSITAAVAKDNVLGCQFHPEKSGEVGLMILRAFGEI